MASTSTSATISVSFLGELAFNGFFLISDSTALDRRSGFPRWVGYFGVIAASAGLVAMFRNVTGAVAFVAEVNNYLLPIWMIVFGIALARYGGRASFHRADQQVV